MRYRKPEELTETDLEWFSEVPQSWDIRKLKFLSDVNSSNVNKKSKEGEEPVELCNYTDVYYNELITNELDFMKATASDKDVERFQLVEGDVIITKDSESQDDMAVPTFVAETKENLLCGYHLALIRSDEKVLSGKYLFRLFQSKKYREEFGIRSNGITRYGLGVHELKNISIHIPPLPEQRSIATFLDRKTEAIDGLILKKEKLIERLKEKRQALITRAVTKGLDPAAPMKDSGIEWLGEIPEEWDTKKLKYIKEQKKNSFVDGPFGSSLKSKHFVKNGDVYVVESNFATTGKISPESLKKITEEHFEEIRRSECQGGDIIIAKIGAQYGLSNILPELDKPAVVSGNSLKLTVNQEVANTKFVHLALLNIKWSGSLSVVVNTTAQPALSLSIMNNIEIAVPPKDEQIEIVNYLRRKKEKYSSMTTQLRNQINKLKEYRQSLISAAVTGKIDVRDEVEVESKEVMV